MSQKIVFNGGTQWWLRDGKYHREDGPAIVLPSGTMYWYRDGLRHRKDGPAIVYANGRQDWFREGNRHREDGPAVVYANGVNFWYLHGETVPDLNIVCRRIQRWYRIRKIRKFVRLINTEGPFSHWFDSPEGWGGKWRMRDLEKFASQIEI